MILSICQSEMHIVKSFATLHCNIRSLPANIDKLSLLLHELKYSFSVIGLSKTRMKHQQDCLVNVSLCGYTVCHNLPLQMQEG
jgi:hypothetical protein